MSISVVDKFTAFLHWFPDSPEFGSWRCICSLCGEVIRQQDGPPLRVWRRDEEARLHRACFVLLTEPRVETVAGPFMRLVIDAPPGGRGKAAK